ncbi:hypothetical protein BJY52DRAFT_1368912 [Lactarius psammicola]|nr:hypothetical protein BJY52DRAFT_1368912 [Lactarius psammicola]
MKSVPHHIEWAHDHFGALFRGRPHVTCGTRSSHPDIQWVLYLVPNGLAPLLLSHRSDANAQLPSQHSMAAVSGPQRLLYLVLNGLAPLFPLHRSDANAQPPSQHSKAAVSGPQRLGTPPPLTQKRRERAAPIPTLNGCCIWSSTAQHPSSSHTEATRMCSTHPNTQWLLYLVLNKRLGIPLPSQWWVIIFESGNCTYNGDNARR